ncbi:MAG: SURF1 family protein [Rhodospirillales bacterium]|jgi:surfeit locus 1 family protein|nr:SURF1 family protein [Rhodospirillales bacterium]
MTRPDRAAAFPVLLTVIVAVMAVTLAGLGTWQLNRMAWKRELVAGHAEWLALAPVDINATVRDAAGLAFRRVSVTGRFDHAHEIHLGPRAYQGVPGYRIFTPLTVGGGRAVIVDRGWVPLKRRDPATREAGQVRGNVTVEGVLRPPGAKGAYTPDNDPARGDWFHADVEAMASHLGLSLAGPWYVRAGPSPNPGGWPRGSALKFVLPDNHLQYALTWYGLAVVLLVIYVIMLWGRKTGPGDGMGDVE